MTIEEIIRAYNVSTAKATPDKALIKQAEAETGVTFGPQLKDYLEKYGSISVRGCEINGLVSTRGMKSSLVSTTVYVHKYFPKTAAYVAVEDVLEGDFVLANSEDEVFFFSPEANIFKPLNIKLFDYIENRFSGKEIL